ncbi:helix-turn-helix domain-containing protein [Niastella yeongjuensis]|nr:helix-turn-helix transcriptional regulator [Niastella yeongjuensis]
MDFSNKAELIAQKIDERIKDLGLNRQEFARLMDVQPSSVTKWLGGKHNFTLETISEIERKLSLSLLDLTAVRHESSAVYSMHVSSSDIQLNKPGNILSHLGNTNDGVHISKERSLHAIIGNLGDENSQNDNSPDIDYYRMVKQGKKL